MNGTGEKILVIINPNAGRYGATELAAELCGQLRQAGAVVREVFTTARGDAREIAFTQGPSHQVVVACGGDGTLSEVISGLMRLRFPPDVGFLPIGSTCDIARTFKLPGKPLKAAQVILNGIPYPIDIGRIQGSLPLIRQDLPPGVAPEDPGQLPDYFSYVTSFGAFTEASYATRRRLKKALGHFAYVLTGLQSVGSIRPFQTTVLLDGADYSGSYIFGGVLNSASVGGLVKLDDVIFNDGLFEVLLVRPPRNVGQTARLVSQLMRQKTGDAIIRRRASHITFRFGKAVPFTVDGEYGGSRTDWQIHNIKQAIRLRVQSLPGATA